MTPAEIEQGRRLQARLSVAECFRAPSDKEAAVVMLGPLLDAYEAAVAENARLREQLDAATSALAFAVVTAAKHSCGGMDDLEEWLKNPQQPPGTCYGSGGRP